jgi:hypothetical protein
LSKQVEDEMHAALTYAVRSMAGALAILVTEVLSCDTGANTTADIKQIAADMDDMLKDAVSPFGSRLPLDDNVGVCRHWAAALPTLSLLARGNELADSDRKVAQALDVNGLASLLDDAKLDADLRRLDSTVIRPAAVASISTESKDLGILPCPRRGS